MRLKIKESITLKVTYANGDSDITRFNGTFEDAQNYYLNKTFNIGSVNDNMQKCVAVDEVSDDTALESTQIKNDNLDKITEDRDCRPRYYTNKVLDLIDNGALSAKDVVMMALKWMSEDDVAEMLRSNDIDLDEEDFDESLTEKQLKESTDYYKEVQEFLDWRPYEINDDFTIDDVAEEICRELYDLDYNDIDRDMAYEIFRACEDHYDDLEESLTEKSNIKVTAKVKASDEDIKHYDNCVDEIFEDALNMQKEISLGKISGLDRYEKLARDIVNHIEDTRNEWHTNESLSEDTNIELSEKLGESIENIKAIKDALNQTVTGKNDNGLGSTGAFASWISTGFDLDMEKIAEVAIAMDFDVYKTDIGYFGDKDYLIMFPGNEITTYPDFDSSFIEDSFEKIN